MKKTVCSVVVCALLSFGVFGGAWGAAAQASSLPQPGSSTTYVIDYGRESSILSTSTPLTTDFILQVNDLQRVGYKNVTRVLPVPGRFEEPIRYFRVLVPTSTNGGTLEDCSDCSSLAVVYVTRAVPTSTPTWVVRANPLIERLGSRLLLRLFAANRIITIIAPGDEKQITALAMWLRERAILNKIN